MMPPKKSRKNTNNTIVQRGCDEFAAKLWNRWMGKFGSKAHVVEQDKSYTIVVESWEANVNASLFARGTIYER